MSKTKKYPEIVATSRIRSLHRPYYFKVILWRNHDALLKATGVEPDTLACCENRWRGTYAHSRKKNTSRPSGRQLGTLHFSRGRWNINVVSHECLHAVLHKARLLGPNLTSLDSPFQNREEDLAYELGFWVEEVVTFLTRHNPKGRLSKLSVDRPANSV